MIMMNRIYNKDAMELLHEIPKGSVDLIILDPSYQEWNKFLDKNIISLSLECIKESGNILCFTKQPFDLKLRNEIDKYFRREIVWTFTNGGAWVSNRMPLVSHQKIYHIVKHSKKSFFNERTGVNYSDNTKSFKRSTKVFEGYSEKGKQFIKSEDGVWLRDHLHFNKPHTGSIPSKPLKLLDILIRCYCPKGGIVVEPFAGSGNFAISCIEQKKAFIGSEINKEVHKCCVEKVYKRMLDGYDRV
jgi:site-specific DNA-methyltransferase (adenine-specific)